MSLLSLLSGLVGGTQAPPAPTGPVDPMTGMPVNTTTDPNSGVTNLSTVTVAPASKGAVYGDGATDAPPPSRAPQAQTANGPTLNYNNSADIDAIQAANASRPPQGGSTNPGIYGLLPANLQHGTLRNTLGAIADAFLVQGGAAPSYADHMDRQALGNAMAGYNQNPQAAIERVAGTGAAGAPNMADTLEGQYQTAQSRKAQLAATQVYHQQLTDSRNANVVDNMTRYIGGQVASIPKDLPPEQQQAMYQTIYDTAQKRARALDPSYDASTLGLVDPTTWTPDQTVGLGMTSNNVQTSNDKGAQRNVSVGNNIRNNSTKVQTTGMNNNTATANNVRTTNTTAADSAASTAERAANGKYTHNKPASGPPNLPKDPQGNYYVNPNTMLTPQQAAALPAGYKIHFRGHDGQWHWRP